MTMSTTISLGHQLKVLITVVLMIAVVAGGWMLGVQPALAASFAANDARTEVRSQNDAIRAELAALQAAEAELPTLEADLAKLNASIPLTDDSSALLDGIHDLADAAGVVVDGITLEDPQPYAPPVAAAPAAAPVEGEAGTTPVTTAPAVDPLQPTSDPRITPANFVLVPVSVSVSGSLDDVLDFVHGVQAGPRLFLVNKLASAADAEGDGSKVAATVGGFVYALLDGTSGVAR
jgi:Tfp pilus assembly protein PilO